MSKFFPRKNFISSYIFSLTKIGRSSLERFHYSSSKFNKITVVYGYLDWQILQKKLIQPKGAFVTWLSYYGDREIARLQMTRISIIATTSVYCSFGSHSLSSDKEIPYTQTNCNAVTRVHQSKKAAAEIRTRDPLAAIAAEGRGSMYVPWTSGSFNRPYVTIVIVGREIVETKVNRGHILSQKADLHAREKIFNRRLCRHGVYIQHIHCVLKGPREHRRSSDNLLANGVQCLTSVWRNAERVFFFCWGKMWKCLGRRPVILTL